MDQSGTSPRSFAHFAPTAQPPSPHPLPPLPLHRSPPPSPMGLQNPELQAREMGAASESQSPDPAQAAQPMQRVPMSAAMLYAYAAMRGTVDKGDLENDPVHNNLYLNSVKFVNRQFEKPINLHKWQAENDRFMVHEHDPGMTFFYDVSKPMYATPAPEVEGLPTTEMAEKTRSYSSHILRKPPKPHPGHSRGGKGYGNYGYIEVNERWVDPDGEIDIMNAIHGDALITPPGLRVGNMPMQGKYTEAMYEDLMQELNEWPTSDCEGDPRGFSITPEIFARMAAGCATGDQFETKKVPVQDPPLREICSTRQVVDPKTQWPGFQFDYENGSAYSAEYSIESHPSLCMSARGVNMTWRPEWFAYSYPQANLDHDRAEYGGLDPNAPKLSKSRVQSWLGAPPGQVIVNYTNENAIKCLADPSDPDPQGGHKTLAYHHKNITSLEGEYLELGFATVPRHSREDSLQGEVNELYKESVFMENRLNKLDIAAGTSPRDRSIAKSTARLTVPRPVLPRLHKDVESPLPHYRAAESYHVHLPAVTESPTSSTTSTPRLRRRPANHMQRYFAERTEQELIKVNKMKMRHAQFDATAEDIQTHITRLKSAHAGYLEGLGVTSVGEIPDLFPRKERREPRVDMLEGLRAMEMQRVEAARAEAEERLGGLEL